MTRVVRGVRGVRGIQRARRAPKPPAGVEGPSLIDLHVPDPHAPTVSAPGRGVRWGAVYGPPGAGVEAAIEVLRRASHSELEVVADPEEATLDLLGDGVILIEGWPRSLEDAGVLGGLLGEVVAIRLDVERGRAGRTAPTALANLSAPRDEWGAWYSSIEEIEVRLDLLCVRRCAILNTDLATTVAEMARRLQISD